MTARFALRGFDDRRRVLRGRVVLPDGSPPWPTVVCVPGYTSVLGWGFWPLIAERLAAAGIATVRFNHSGYGVGADLVTFDDEELFSRNGYVWELEDLARIHDLVHDSGRALDPSRLALLGHSRGGGIGIVHAAETGDYRAIVTWAAIDSVLRFTPERLEEWRRDGEIVVCHPSSGRRAKLDLSVLESAEQNRGRLDILAACQRLSCPMLVVHAERDASVPAAAAERIAAAAGGDAERVTIAAADHVFGARQPLADVPPELDAVITATTGWLADRLLDPE